MSKNNSRLIYILVSLLIIVSATLGYVLWSNQKPNTTKLFSTHSLPQNYVDLNTQYNQAVPVTELAESYNPIFISVVFSSASLKPMYNDNIEHLSKDIKLFSKRAAKYIESNELSQSDKEHVISYSLIKSLSLRSDEFILKNNDKLLKAMGINSSKDVDSIGKQLEKIDIESITDSELIWVNFLDFKVRNDLGNNPSQEDVLTMLGYDREKLKKDLQTLVELKQSDKEPKQSDTPYISKIGVEAASLFCYDIKTQTFYNNLNHTATSIISLTTMDGYNKYDSLREFSGRYNTNIPFTVNSEGTIIVDDAESSFTFIDHPTKLKKIKNNNQLFTPDNLTIEELPDVNDVVALSNELLNLKIFHLSN